jgi:zinc/manganese transport system permease protein
MELAGVQRVRDRDLAAGIVLGAGLGLAALFLYLDATYTSTAGATVTVLFGSLFALSDSLIPAVAALGGVALALVLVLQRQLLLSSLSSDLAAARGLPVRAISALYLAAVAVSVALAALTISAILGTALLIGPAATALRLCRRPGQAMLAAAGLGVLATWLGVVLAYDSYSWPPAGRGWPVSFFVVAGVLAFYICAGVVERARGGR